MATIKSDSIDGLKAQIDTATQQENGIPGVQYYAVNKNGDYVFEHTSGKIGQGKEEDMAPNHAMWIASCTKQITAIACMQLVEQGKLNLDDAALVEKYSPELRDVKVLEESGKLVEKKRGITLRMLLTHTAGFGYSFFSHRLLNHFGPIGLHELSGDEHEILKQPLLFQPGESYAYGTNIDFVGLIVSRASGLTLHEYIQKNITIPLGIDKDITFFPDEQMKADLTYFHYRDPAGKVQIRDEGAMFYPPLTARTTEQRAAIFQAGGHGCFARPRAYCQIIATLLNDGLHAPSGNRILRAETVEQMFTNQIPQMPNFARVPSEVSKAEYANAGPEMYPEPGNPAQGWGLSMFLHLQDSFVHSKGTGWWAGLPNQFWWCDRAKGLGGIIAAQIVPFGDLKVVTLWATVEGGLYANLVQPEGGEKTLEVRTKEVGS